MACLREGERSGNVPGARSISQHEGICRAPMMCPLFTSGESAVAHTITCV